MHGYLQITRIHRSQYLKVKESILIRGIKQQPWEFRNDDVKLKSVIGTGQFGDVKAGEVVIKGKLKKVAVKLGKEDDSGHRLNKEQLKELLHEARLMRLFKHENILKTYGVAVHKEPIMIILELIKGGCILEVLHSRRGHISEYEKAGHMCLGTAEGLAYLHAHRCIHRDIAARNVLYTHDKIAKISDFGLSYVGDCYVVRRSKKIPLRWTAPESFTTFKFTAKTDVYSFAIFMWEVLTDGDEPYAHKTNIEVRRMVEKGDRLARPKGCSNETFSIVEKCWISNPDFRCSMKEVVHELKELKTKRLLPDVERVKSDDLNSSSMKFISSARRRKRVKKIVNRDEVDITLSGRHPRFANITSIKIIRRKKPKPPTKENAAEDGKRAKNSSSRDTSNTAKDDSKEKSTTDPKD